MDFTRFDKNRMTVAVIATAVLIPLLFMAGGNSSNSSAEPIKATTSTYDLGLSSDGMADAPANLDGPVSQDPNGSGEIAYPADNDGQMARVIASYKRFPNSAKTGCSTASAPLGATVTVRNLNNGHKTTCLNINIGPTSGTFGIIMNTTVFEAIAELVDAPLPVELTW
jgi:hypothetical protein